MIGPSGGVFEHRPNLRSHRQGHPKNGHTDLSIALCSGESVHQADLDLKEGTKHILDMCPFLKLRSKLDANQRRFGRWAFDGRAMLGWFNPSLMTVLPARSRQSVDSCINGRGGRTEPPLSLIGLIRTLTAPATAPHLFGFLAVVIALFVTVGNVRGLETEVAAAFVGMGVSYAAVAGLADHATFRTWIVAERKSTVDACDRSAPALGRWCGVDRHRAHDR